MDWQTADVGFVADDLGAWLVSLLADAGRKKLVAMVLGDEQERSLRMAAAAAVRLTSAELDITGGDQTEQLAMIIGQVFCVPIPETMLTGQATLLQQLEAGISSQLAVLGDADLTGVGESSADVLDVPVGMVAQRLASNLVQEIMLRGSRGGPLAPLADQLNHDLTHLQGQRLEGRLASLADMLEDALAKGAVGSTAIRPVRLLPRPGWIAGRKDLLATLDIRLSAGNVREPRVATLCGLGGIGKTSLALEYAYQHMGSLSLVWQFAAGDPAMLAAGFDDLAGLLRGRGLASIGEPVAQVHAVLAGLDKAWLLIFDNATDHLALQKVLPPAGDGQVLITSQNPHWPGDQAINVPVLDHDIAAEFLQTRIASADKDRAGELADELGGLPLALEQAAAYMITTGRSIAEYLAAFRSRYSNLLARGEPTGYNKQVATTWALAFDYLEQSAPMAVMLLRLLACCAAEQIPLRLLLCPRPSLGDSLPMQVTALLTDTLDVDDAVTALRRFSLISPPSDGVVSVHRLVQAVTLAQLPTEQAETWRRATRILIEAALPDDPRRPDTWPAFAALLPHAQVALPANSDSMAQLVNYLGVSGSYTAALALARQVVEEATRESGAEDPATLIYCANLAYWTGAAGDAAAARDQYATLLLMMERVNGAETLETLVTCGNLARWTGEAGDAAGARDQFAALLPVIERGEGDEHPQTLWVRGELANWTGKAGDAAAARDQFAALLPVRERVSGAEHPDTLLARGNLAFWTGKAGDAAAARDQFAALLPVRERVSGAEHPDTLLARGNLATWTAHAGDRFAARLHYVALVPVMQRVLGADHPSTLVTSADLAHCTGEAGDAAAARDQLAALLPDMERVLGSEHPDTLLRRKRLADWTGQAGDAAAARDLFTVLLAVHMQISGAEHPDTLDIQGYIAFYTWQAGDVGAARTQLASLLPTIERVNGVNHAQALAIREFLANLAP